MPYLQKNMSDNQGTKNAPIWNNALVARTYKSETDTLAQILAAGYFNDALNDYTISVGDIITVRGSDANTEILEVTALTPNVTTTSVVSGASIPDGSITTAKLANEAVTDAKVANLTLTKDKIATRTLVADKFATYNPTNTEPTIPLTHYQLIPSGGTTTYDKTFSGTGMVITHISINWITDGDTGDGVQIKSSIGADITEIYDTEQTAGAMRWFTVVDQANSTVNIGGFVRASVNDFAGNDAPSLLIGYHGYVTV